MGPSRDDSFSVHITRPGLERLTLAELDEASRGVLFVSAPTPPRVGTRVLIDVSVANSRQLRQQGLVVWSRPARPGQSAGFRAQLENAHPAVLNSLREAIDPVRAQLVTRPPPPPSEAALDIRERVRPAGQTRRIRREAPPSPAAEELELDVEVSLEETVPPAPAAPAPERPPSDLRRRHLFKTVTVLALPPPLLMLPGPKPGEVTARLRRERPGQWVAEES